MQNGFMHCPLVLIDQNKIILPDWLRNTWKKTPPAPTEGQWSEGLYPFPGVQE